MKLQSTVPAADLDAAPEGADASFALGAGAAAAHVDAGAWLQSPTVVPAADVVAALPVTQVETPSASAGSPLRAPAAALQPVQPAATPVALPLISVSDVVIGEEDGYVDLTVSLSAPGINAVSVNYRSYDGTANDYNLSDFGYVNGSLTFAPGETSKTVRVTLTNDTVAEVLEHFYLVLSAPTNGVLARSTATVTLVDNDTVVDTPELFVRDVVVDEKAGTATFMVTLGKNGGQSAADTISVNYATANGTASGADYTATSGSLSFAPGESLKTVTVAITDDTSAEGAQRFLLNLSGANGALIVDGSAIAEIGANDATAVAQPRLSVKDVVVGEDDGFVDVVVSLSAPGQSTVTVDFRTADGSANDYNVSDYYYTAGKLTFTAGETTKVVRVQLKNDAVAEPLEHFFFFMSGPTNATVANPYTRVTVVDNDTVQATPELFVRDVVVDEKAGTASFMVTLGKNGGVSSNDLVTVDYATSGGTAVSGTDFTAASGTLTFAVGESVKTVVVDLTDDTAAEGFERFGLTLSDAVGATLRDGQATALIGANDATAVALPRLSVSDLVVDESDGFVDVVVSLSAPGQSNVSVSYRTYDGTANDYQAQDYTSASTTLLFAAGETTKTVRVYIGNNSVAESLEHFFFNLYSPVNATISQEWARITVIDNDSVVDTPALYVRDVVVDEKAGTATFMVTLGKNGGQSSNDVVTVNYATVDGSALGGSDFIATSGKLSFAVGESVKTVVVDIRDDSAAEGVERFGLNLSGASNATLGDGRAIGEIRPNDSTAVAQPRISVSDLVVGEDEGFVDVLVSLSAPGQSTVTVSYRTFDGRAGDYQTQDYSATSASLTFAPGETAKTVRVYLADGATAESLEHFYFSLSSPVNATIAQATAMLTVVDNDTVVDTPGLFVRDVVVDEKAGTATFVVTLGLNGGQSSNSDITVDYATANATATGTDYSAASGTLTFRAGESLKTVVVDIKDDTSAEKFERFSLNLSNADGATILDGAALATIGANDGSAVAQPRISVTDLVVGEDDGYVDMVVSLSAPGQNIVTVSYGTTDGTADSYAARDFWGASGTLTFAVGETTKTVRVHLTDDGVAEPLDYFRFNLSAPVNATLGQSGAMVTVVDSDNVVDAPSLFVRDVVVDEKAGTASFVVTLGLNGGQGSNSPVKLNYATTDGSAVAGSDYVAQTGSLTFAVGESVKTVVVDLIDDSAAEGLERFGLRLSAVGDASLLDSTATAEIGANDGTAVLQPRILVRDLVLAEEDGYVDLVVSLSAPSLGNVAVTYALQDVTADNYGAQDYSYAGGTLNFAAGETLKTVRVQLTDDNVAESLQHFRVTLAGAVGATIDRNSSMVTIVDNDNVVDTPNVYVRDVQVDEKQGTASFVVWLGQSGGQSANQTVTVKYASADGSATAGSDYVAVGGTLKFAPGEVMKTVVVDITDDNRSEGLERFGLLLNSASNAVIADAAAVALIGRSDNTPALQPTVSAGDITVAEGDGYVDVAVRLSAPSASPVSVNYATQPVTASYSDYVGVSGTLNFAVGETTKVVRMELYGDTVSEVLESFRLNLSGAVGALIGNTYGTISLVDDDTFDVDVMSYGLGDDVYLVDEATDVVVESADGGTDLVRASVSHTLNAEVENLLLTGSEPLDGTGNGSANGLTGNSAKNTLSGLAGNDTLDGGGNADSMVGGTGNDTYVVQNGGDKTVELSNQGIDVVRSSIDHTLANHVDHLVLTGSAGLNGTGNGLDNLLTGNSGANRLGGGSGNDTLDGGAGSDSLTGGSGNDTYVVERSGDKVFESAGGGSDLVRASIDYTLGSEVEHLTLTGSAPLKGTGNAGRNLLTGNSGNNTLSGASGNDTLDGGAGNDSMIGGSGNDLYRVDSAGDVARESAGGGIDRVISSVNFSLGAESENLTLSGSGNLAGTGNSLANVLVGNSGKNTLNGASGSDTLTGGAGDDTFVIASVSGSDTLTDFNSGDDQLRVSQGPVTVGDGDNQVEGAVRLGGPGGFSAAAELVIISKDIGGDLSASKAASAIGSANGNYASGRTVLFVVDNGESAGLYLFTSSGSNASVSSSELDLIATFEGTSSLSTADFLFGA